MRGTLPRNATPIQLRPGVQPALAASADDERLAAEQELISILQGPSFQGSKRSQSFLRFVVEEALAGRRETLKERTVGVAVLGKATDYDTGADSTVRVRANEVRKRLAAHYDSASPKAGLRIELPAGTYAPRFVMTPAAPPVSRVPHPPPMRLRQLAAPTLVACFFALVAIRANVDSNDSFSIFWNHALAGHSEIEVVVDSAGGSISPQIADAAMPFEALAVELRVPVHIIAAETRRRDESCLIRLSVTAKPSGRGLRLGRAEVFPGGKDDPAIWLWADNPSALRAAAQTLATKTAFPEELRPPIF